MTLVKPRFGHAVEGQRLSDGFTPAIRCLGAVRHEAAHVPATDTRFGWGPAPRSIIGIRVCVQAAVPGSDLSTRLARGAFVVTYRDVSLRVDRLDGKEPVVIEQAQWLAEFFFTENASSATRGQFVPFDLWVPESPPNRIVAEDIHAINQSMAARTSLKHWQGLIGSGELPWLAALDRTWDLLLMSEADWTSNAVERLIGEALSQTIGPWRGPSVATKVLYGKRPRLIPICDELVARQIGAKNDARFTLQAIGHIRAVGRANLDQLRAIDGHLQACDPPIARTLARILDALLWASTPGLVPYAQFRTILARATSPASVE